jgi:hypothetical protein
MKTSKRHQKRIIDEDGCRAARRAAGRESEERRRRFPVADPALRRMSPFG